MSSEQSPANSEVKERERLVAFIRQEAEQLSDGHFKLGLTDLSLQEKPRAAEGEEFEEDPETTILKFLADVVANKQFPDDDATDEEDALPHAAKLHDGVLYEQRTYSCTDENNDSIWAEDIVQDGKAWKPTSTNSLNTSSENLRQHPGFPDNGIPSNEDGKEAGHTVSAKSGRPKLRFLQARKTKRRERKLIPPSKSKKRKWEAIPIAAPYERTINRVH
eukprot:jgi/Bigna1/84613/fgenesh1_pg.174_\